MIKTLLSVRLSSFASALSGKSGGKKQSPAKTVLFILLYAYVAAVFLGLSVLMAIAMGKALLPIGGGGIYLALFACATFTVIFVMSIFETKSELFDCKDNELILSMPIKPRDIVLSRIFTVMIYNYVTALVVMAPATVVYGVMSGDATGFIGAFISMILIPLPATALSAYFGYWVAVITRRTRHNTLFTVAFSVAFLLLYFWGYSKMMSAGEDFFENIDGSVIINSRAAGALAVIGNALLLKPLEFCVFAAASLIISLACYFILSKSYVKIATSSVSVQRALYKAEKMKEGSAVSALVKKEFSKITSSSLYMLNAGLGTVFRVIAGVLAIAKSSEILAVLDMLSLEMPGISVDGVKAIGVCIAVIILSSMDAFSASSVSLEGKSLWIIKSMPIRAYDVLFAKTLTHTAICATASVISVSLILIAIRASVYCWLLALGVAVASSLCFALFGTVINVALPKLEFENEAQPIKQSLACFVSLFGQMLFGMVMLVLSMFGIYVLGGYLTALLVLVVLVILCVALYFIMSRASVRRFANL